MVITDAMCAAGEPDGIYSLGGLRVKVEKGRATLADVPYDPKAVVSNVAGSVALFPDCFRRFARVSGLPLEEAVKAAGYYIHSPQVEDYDLWVRMMLRGSKFYNIQRSLLYFRMSDDFARRRGGWNYSRREIPLQISFYKKGYISWGRMVLNTAIRTIIRMLPSQWRRKIYLRLLR